MINKLVTYVLRNRNQFPASDGISDRISPLGIVLGYPLPSYKNLHLEFGTYVQVFEDRKITNRTDTRSVGAIALSMTPCANGTYEFISLTTGKILCRKKITILPISEAVIHQVEQLALAEKNHSSLVVIFYWSGAPMIPSWSTIHTNKGAKTTRQLKK